MRSARLAFVAAALLVVLAGCVPVWLLPRASDLPKQPAPPPLPSAECPWTSSPPPTAAGAGAGPGADPIAETEAIALDEDRFWPLVESVPDRPSPDDFSAVSSQLAGCPFDDIIAFEARLTLALHALDGPENLDWFEENDPSGTGFASDDTFLYARCAAVLGGRESWAVAVRERTLDWGDDSPDLSGISEYLLYVGVNAAVSQGVDPDAYYGIAYAAIPISYETGSNAELWN